jgi:ABC-2 type transport system permease protein
MMLLLKAWRESRVRFIASALALAGMCAAFVYFHTEVSRDLQVSSFVSVVWSFAYRGYMREFFMVMVLLLGVGGLLRERAYGTAVFTLVLPVDRWRIVAARAVAGLLEVAALALVPALVIPATSALVGQHYPVFQALQFSLLWIGCGTVLFSMAFFFSTILGGEYSAPVASFLGLLGYSALVELPFIQKYPVNIHDIMSGSDMPYFEPATSLLIGPFPWTAMLIITLLGVGLLAVSARITDRQDF